MKKGGLGRGIDILFEDNSSNTENAAKNLRLSEIEPNKNQPRKNFDEEALAALAESIKQHGLLQPILVRTYKNGYQIIAGERRWRACRMLGMDEIPAFIREMSDSDVMQVAIIENLQREDLNPIEEALGFKELIDTYNMTQEEVAKTVGCSRPVITNALRLLNLSDEVQGLLKGGNISVGHAKALLAIPDEKLQSLLAKQAANGMLTVRDIERAAQKLNAPIAKTKPHSRKDSYLTEMQIALTEALGQKVKIENNAKKIVLQIEVSSKDELADLAQRITK